MTPVPAGIVTPVLTAVPGMHAPWERAGDVDALLRVAQCADRVGIDHLTCSEHVAVPTQVAQVRGGTYWDPLASLSYLAGATSRIRLLTYVLVLGYAHPLAVAKRYGTLDRLSQGRVVLGLGVGSLREEFDLLGASYDDRGHRADDALRALRAGLTDAVPAYRGRHYAFDEMVLEPRPMQERVPLWIGGQGGRSLRRAVELGDGWAPFGLRPSAAAELLGEHDLPAGFEVVLPVGPLDPLGEAPSAGERIERAQQAGATRVTVSLRSESPEHYCDQLQALAELPQVRA